MRIQSVFTVDCFIIVVLLLTYCYLLRKQAKLAGVQSHTFCFSNMSMWNAACLLPGVNWSRVLAFTQARLIRLNFDLQLFNIHNEWDGSCLVNDRKPMPQISSPLWKQLQNKFFLLICYFFGRSVRFISHQKTSSWSRFVHHILFK